MKSDLPDFSSFEATIASLFSRVRGHIKPGAHRMQRLVSKPTLEKLSRLPTILVTGTNGKGSVCALLEHYLRCAGKRTALYTSPHLVSPTERIRICGIPVSNETFLSSAKNAFEAAKVDLPDATFFELMTALAFDVITIAEVNVFICEVGLGGRLDSTNVLSPWVSVLTNVGLEHTEWLGPTETDIAFEKSFISRRNRAFVVGDISETAKAGLNRALTVTGATPAFVAPLSDTTQETENLARVVLQKFEGAGGCRFNEIAFVQACAEVFWPGRMDVRSISGVKVMLDAAHNAHGVNYLLKQLKSQPTLRALPRPWILVYATLSDKNWQEALKLLALEVDALHLTQTHSSRAVHVNELLHYTSNGLRRLRIQSHVTSSEALAEGLNDAQRNNGSLLVLGSITLLGEAMEFFSLPVFPKQETLLP